MSRPAEVVLPGAIRDAIVTHARAEAPLEACGIVLGDAPFDRGGRALRFVPCRNAAASAYRFELADRDLIALTLAAEAAGETFWAIVHSHVRSEARPSPTDIRAALHPDAIHLIVGPLEGDLVGSVPIQAWHIADESFAELAIRIG